MPTTLHIERINIRRAARPGRLLSNGSHAVEYETAAAVAVIEREPRNGGKNVTLWTFLGDVVPEKKSMFNRHFYTATAFYTEREALEELRRRAVRA